MSSSMRDDTLINTMLSMKDLFFDVSFNPSLVRRWLDNEIQKAESLEAHGGTDLEVLKDNFIDFIEDLESMIKASGASRDQYYRAVGSLIQQATFDDDAHGIQEGDVLPGETEAMARFLEKNPRVAEYLNDHIQLIAGMHEAYSRHVEETRSRSESLESEPEEEHEEREDHDEVLETDTDRSTDRRKSLVFSTNFPSSREAHALKEQQQSTIRDLTRMVELANEIDAMISELQRLKPGLEKKQLKNFEDFTKAKEFIAEKLEGVKKVTSLPQMNKFHESVIRSEPGLLGDLAKIKEEVEPILKRARAAAPLVQSPDTTRPEGSESGSRTRRRL